MQNKINKKEMGFVISAKDYLVEIEGLPSAKIDDLIEDEDGNIAVVTSLQKNGIKALYLKRVKMYAGKRFFLKGKNKILYFGEELFGRVVNPLGEPLDGKNISSKRNTDFKLNIESKGIESRKSVKEQFETGISVIDTLFPLGKGQRQMLFGPIRSGKTKILTDIIKNQAKKDSGEDVICIYTAIGKSADFLDRIKPILFGEDGNKKTIIISALSNVSPPLIAIAPAIAILLAEHFKNQGKDVFIAFDDLGSHAKYLREIGLLKEILPGRDSYPGDLFYEQAHLIERAGSFNDNFGGGSITLVPVLETEIESYSDYLSTNLISTTDGHLSCSDAFFRRGIYPPILTEESVTRIGRTTQNFVQKQLSIKIISTLSEAKKQEEYSKFGTQISDKSRKKIKQGKILRKMLNQDSSEFISNEIQSIFLSLAFTSFFENESDHFFEKNRRCVLSVIKEGEEFKKIKEISKNQIEIDDFIEKLEEKVTEIRKICQ